MTTLTIDIPDNTTIEVISQLKKLGVTVRESKLDKLDTLTKDDYQKHFAQQGKINRKKLSDETAYLL